MEKYRRNTWQLASGLPNLVHTRTWPTRAAARQAIFEWLEVWYNRQRLHSALAYQAPVAHEAQHLLLLQDQAA
jgi:transposase InsO family protein